MWLDDHIMVSLLVLSIVSRILAGEPYSIRYESRPGLVLIWLRAAFGPQARLWACLL